MMLMADTGPSGQPRLSAEAKYAELFAPVIPLIKRESTVSKRREAGALWRC
jgi:hypothetical protein